jgi:SHS family lactate transporter-like MFS transporter
MIAALLLSIAVIPAWAFGRSLAVLAAGAFLMQVGVQGAWGVIPAHLNELSPSAVRGLMPGFAYQLGILLAAPTNSIEFALQRKLGYPWALAVFETVNIVLLAVTLWLGSERKGRSFLRGEAYPPAEVTGGDEQATTDRGASTPALRGPKTRER